MPMKQPMVLLVMRRPERLPLLWALEAGGACVFMASRVLEAEQLLQTVPALDVVFTDYSLPDGEWKNVLDVMRRTSSQAALIVCARMDEADENNLLKQGAFAVLRAPCGGDQVRQLLDRAVGCSVAA
jgi:DNA-binding NtrC family response regulator